MNSDNKTLLFNGRLNISTRSLESGTWPNRIFRISAYIFSDNLDGRSISDIEAGDILIDSSRNRFIFDSFDGSDLLFHEDAWDDQLTEFTGASSPYTLPETGANFLFRQTTNSNLFQHGRTTLGISDQIVGYLSQKANYQVEEILGSTALSLNSSINMLGTSGAYAPTLGQTGGIPNDRPNPVLGDEWVNPDTGDRFIYNGSIWEETPNNFQTSELTFSEVYEKVKDASVSIAIDGGTGGFFVGSGFIISATGTVATVGHNMLKSNREDPADALYCTVTNVNGVTGLHVVYPVEFIGVDGSGDIAVLQILSGSPNPEPALTSHPFVTFADSRELKPGDLAFVIGNPLGNDSQSISQGVVRDPIFTDRGGGIPFEQVMIDNSAFGGNSGSPIVNNRGEVIGVFSFVYVLTDSGGDGAGAETFGGGPASHIMSHVVDAILSGMTGATGPVQEVSSGDYLYYNKGFLGLADWHSVRHFDVLFDYGISSSSPEVKGIVIDSITSGSPLASSSLSVGDWIVEVDGVATGYLSDQYPVGSITWFKYPGDSIEVKYMSPPSTTIITTNITLASYPVASDVLFSGDTNSPANGMVRKILQPIRVNRN